VAHRDVLIVDDDRRVSLILRQIFEAAGYTCRLAGDGDEVWKSSKSGDRRSS